MTHNGPWRVVERAVMEDGSVYPRHIITADSEYQICIMESAAVATLHVCQPESKWANSAANLELAHLIAAAPELLEALRAYQQARAMPSIGDYAAMPYTFPKRTFNASYGGGECEKHGVFYGRCHCCDDDLDKARRQADRDAIHARDAALMRAAELSGTAIAKATGEAP